ncbi:hypothetical protein AZI86_15275 [Bdellovibrio bacteriovorus]|uniref:ComEC/Rec2-related protein domain-containing protein n=1 Tax=Bdellovibrio bacteriovorus TaxID=959 RepID=A0A150WHW6_BDEBC|nr:ComEC/Rec2 family competence protein [Bdellovibrio bacteriovorus]KYG63079.1 hypothetical protein AZI86_15275 [Bdellovibrio bacteriovorus]
MLFLLIIALALSITPPDSLLKNTSALSKTYQQKCLKQVPTDATTRASIQALLCGEKITDSRLKENLSKTSLIHIFIVSGSHLILLDRFLSILKIPLFLRFLSLGFYSLAVGWQAPAVRALGALLLRSGLRYGRIAFPGDLVVLACGLLTLAIFPTWWQSLSFQMSWCAALALSAPSVLGLSSRSWKGALLSHFLILLIMAPLLWGWASLHPVGVLSNLLLAPLVALVLLPLSFTAVFHEKLLQLFSHVMSFFEATLSAVAEPVVIPSSGVGSSSSFWIWIFLLHILFHFLRLHLRQGKDLL